MSEETLSLIEKIILPVTIFVTGYFVTRRIEKIKSNEGFINEITKTRVERISRFYDLYSEYEHWVNRLITHSYHQFERNEHYLTREEFDEANQHMERIENVIGLELNQMRFWITDDIYFHTVGQLELVRELKIAVFANGEFNRRDEFRLRTDSLRMNLDKLVTYLKSKQNIRKIRYDRSAYYKNGSQ